MMTHFDFVNVTRSLYFELFVVGGSKRIAGLARGWRFVSSFKLSRLHASVASNAIKLQCNHHCDCRNIFVWNFTKARKKMRPRDSGNEVFGGGGFGPRLRPCKGEPGTPPSPIYPGQKALPHPSCPGIKTNNPPK